MPKRTVRIAAATGLHARSAALFVEAAAAQPVEVTIAKPGGTPVPAHSILSVLALGAAHGTEVTLSADGEEAEASLDHLRDLLSRDLDAEEPTDG